MVEAPIVVIRRVVAKLFGIPKSGDIHNLDALGRKDESLVAGEHSDDHVILRIGDCPR